MKRRMLDHILARFESAPQMAALGEAVRSGVGRQLVREARGGAPAAMTAALARQLNRPILLLTSSLERAESITDGLQFFGASPLLYPAFETLPFETTEPALHISSARNRALAALLSFGEPEGGGAPPLIVAPADALAFRVLPRDEQAKRSIRLAWAQPVDFDTLAERLTAMGYRREALVESPGEFAIRGSIIDIYPPDAEWPWRLEFFGDELEEIRLFDPETQRSKQLDSDIEAVELLASSCHAPKLDMLAAAGELATFADLMPRDTLVVLDGAERVRQRLLRFDEIARRNWDERHSERHEAEERCPAFDANDFKTEEWLVGEAELEKAFGAFQTVELADMGTVFGDESPGGAIAISLGADSLEAMPSKFEEYLARFRHRINEGYRVMVVCDNNGQLMRLDELLRENEVSAAVLDDEAEVPGALPGAPEDRCRDILLAVGELHDGFECSEAKILVVADREIFGRYRRRHIYRKVRHGKPIAGVTEIERGNFVIHVEHGVGLFERIRRQEVDGAMREFLELVYAEEARLLVPVEKLPLVHKYSGADAKPPTLDKLGGKRWGRRTQRVMESVRKMAGELLGLYARREAAQGFAFGPDTTWQCEFEASFIYQETPDQLKAIEDVRADMMRLKPMDRLVCGDVGYGKTEVAIRAAFKAATEGKQVAVLAPTTLLIHQHYNTFVERFGGYPITIDMLSRFRTTSESREIIKQLGTGEVQLICGTHRLLGKDVKFKDLGLLIVDEEQRFGVAQKEKIKSLRPDVDVLTLTATPIPRTLHMALAGLRDLSVIHTPPANRLPIRTRTIRWDREQIEEAILRELNRSGQVFFIHNRVETIEEVTATIKEIVPGAKIAFAHGQMEDGVLEKIMLDFIEGRTDILVSTTIVENGIDIPNVNTIVINRADTFGLAQLYQLRGRVGRDVRQAYAYLILPPGQAITPQAVKRLEALEEFTELGVGFKIAMRDLEIRGAGNILGRDQHGAINDIGFEMYCRLLEEAVRELKGMDVQEAAYPTEVRWPCDQFLPEDYIPVESQRIRFYKDFAAAKERGELEDLIEELVDRYGAPPPSAQNLVAATRLKLAAGLWKADTVKYDAANGVVRVTVGEMACELMDALKAKASAGRKTFSGLRRNGPQVLLNVRELAGDDEFKPSEVLTASADFLESA